MHYVKEKVEALSALVSRFILQTVQMQIAQVTRI